MRKNFLVISALSALALAGCKTTDDVANLELCGLECPQPVKPVKPTSAVPAVPDVPAGVGTTGVNTTGNTGNTTNLSLTDPNVDQAIALELAFYLAPQNGQTTSKSRLTETADGNGNFVSAQVEIDTETASNSNWPKSKPLYRFNPEVDPDQLGANSYREYRVITAPDAGTQIDESLQVWTYNNSRAYQYRHSPQAGEAVNQLWGYGGTKTALAQMPSSGTASYNGRFGATAKTWQWQDAGSPPVDINNSWGVNGNANLTADFAGGTMNGTLTPTTWKAFDKDGQYTTVLAANTADVNFKPFMPDAVALRGTISGNQYAGTAHLMPRYVSFSSANQGAFFGTNAAETTGVFTVTGTLPAPAGSGTGINDDRRNYIEMSGFYHGQ